MKILVILAWNVNIIDIIANLPTFFTAPAHIGHKIDMNRSPVTWKYH